MLYHVTYLLQLNLIVYQNLWHSLYVSKLTPSPLHVYQNFVIVLNSHAYVDKKTIVIFIKETNNVKEAFPTVKLSSPKQKITAMNGITIVEFQLMWIDIMHLHKLLNIAVQISEHTRTIAKVTDKKLLTSKPLAPSPCDMQKVLKYGSDWSWNKFSCHSMVSRWTKVSSQTNKKCCVPQRVSAPTMFE